MMSARVIIKTIPFFYQSTAPIPANTNILNSDYAPQLDYAILRVFAAVDNAAILYIILNKQKLCLNSCNPLTANALYAFDILVSKQDRINFQLGAAANVLLRLFEVTL